MCLWSDVVGGVLIALTVDEEAYLAAGGDIIEAMHGLHCGPNCWHAGIGDEAERQAWWDLKIARAKRDWGKWHRR